VTPNIDGFALLLTRALSFSSRIGYFGTMNLILVVVAVSLTAVVSANAWPDVNLENSAASSLIFGALGSANAAAPCKCAIPRECTTGNV